MNSKPVLKIDWATHEAAKYACEKWHYSKSIPAGKLVKVGAWENDVFVGCVIYGRGANQNIGSPYGLDQTECIELVRIALKKHETPVSKILSFANRFLKKQSTGIKLIVSYADPEQGHHGGIYQADNWIYAGLSASSNKCFYKGKWVHQRTVDSKYGNHRGFKTKKTSGKHIYLKPVDELIQKKIQALSKPYPKRASSRDNAATADQVVEGGVIPTDALQLRDDDAIS